MVPQIQPPHVTPHILMKVVSKFHSPSPSSLGGVRRKPSPGIKRFSFIDMSRLDKNLSNLPQFLWVLELPCREKPSAPFYGPGKIMHKTSFKILITFCQGYTGVWKAQS